MTLENRLQEDDVKDLPDWAAADVLNSPDPTQTIIVTWEPTKIGAGAIMDTLGPVDGAALLDQLVELSKDDAVIRWGLKVLEFPGLDLSLENTRIQVSGLVASGLITEMQKDALFALSKRERYPSWAEANNIYVNARTVGLARGAKE
jgi:hypothetical protein